MISVAGPEPAASSSRIRIMGGLYLVWRLYALVIALVGIGLPRSSQRILSSFAPRSLPVVLMSDDLEPVRASRRASLAQPGRARPVQVERPPGRTAWTGRARSGCLRCATGRSGTAGHPR